ncbi:MAG: cation:proton antiporter [Anaerolineae bacterium]|nr:cation:proton antiporter [Anaerolineae bacterium]
MLNALNEPVAIFLTIMSVILIAPLLSKRVHLPGIVGLILGGLLVGPHMLGILNMTPTIELLGTVGLVYLMFSAGLEINLKQFVRVRNKAMSFGVLTFLIPQVVTTLIGHAFGLNWMSSILLGATFASHTLIAYPILSRLGVVRNEAIAVVVGATVFTDVAALLVLAVIANMATTGSLTPLALIKLVIFTIIYAGVILQGLPRLGKLFFHRFNGRDIEFQFVLVALFVAAVTAEVIGMHAIVGAFLAGLAINATLPEHSAVKGQVLFLGNSFFIPMFMIYVGMIINPAAFIETQRTLSIGLTMTTTVYVTKFVAAWITSRIYNFGRNELLVFWGLSQAQAAATIATILVGVELKLFDMTIFNGAILSVLFTSITSPILVERFGRQIKMPPPAIEQKPVFDRILIPLANPETQEYLITLASLLCNSYGGGTLLPLNVAQEVNGEVRGLAEQKQLLGRVTDILEDPDTRIEPIYRIGRSIGSAILRASIETDSSLIVMGWQGETSIQGRIFGTVLDHVFWGAKIPVFVARIKTPINSMKRILFVTPNGSLQSYQIDETLMVILNITQALNVPLYILTAMIYEGVIREFLQTSETEVSFSISTVSGIVSEQVQSLATVSDLIIVPTAGSRLRFTSSLGHIPEQLADAVDSSIIVIHW